MPSGREEGWASVQLSYQSWGTLNSQKSNAILIFHALSGSQNVTGETPEVPEAGQFWNGEVKGRMVEWTCWAREGHRYDQYFVVCFNLLGGCYGSTGPSSINPETDPAMDRLSLTFLFQTKPRSRDFFLTTWGSINSMPLPGPRSEDLPR